MFYALANSKCVHSKQECVRSRVKDLPRVEWNDSYRRCRYCVWDGMTCIICKEELNNCIHCACSEDHHICRECLNAYVDQKLHQPMWDGMLTCPCGHSNGIMTNLPAGIESKIEDYTQRPPAPNSSYARCPVDIAIEKIVTLQCRNCKSAFYDFTGCLAIHCRCNAHFCALCLETFTSSRDCHSHVLKCKWNCDSYGLKRGEYFMSIDNWKKTQHTRVCFQLWMYTLKLYFQTGSTLYAIGVLSHLSNYASPLPWSLSRIASSWKTYWLLMFICYASFDTAICNTFIMNLVVVSLISNVSRQFFQCVINSNYIVLDMDMD